MVREDSRQVNMSMSIEKYEKLDNAWKKTDDVIKVYLKNGKFVCSDKKNPEDYILYTALHPEFIG
jgi:hypothetical protein